jgi:hypothetical protein
MDLAQVTYSSPSPAFGWDGTHGGELVEDLAQEQERSDAFVVRSRLAW